MIEERFVKERKNCSFSSITELKRGSCSEIEKWDRTEVLGANYRYQRDDSRTMGREKSGS